MPGKPFAARVNIDGPDTYIELHGDINRAAQDGLADAYVEAELGLGRLLLDFADVDYINSTGIALIVGILARARADHREVGAFGLTEHYRELFEITRLSDFMTIYDRPAAAAGE